MKSVAEGIAFIKTSYLPNDEISYEAIDNFMEITGVPWLERQNIRFKYAKRLNTILRRGIEFGDSRQYVSLWVNERGKSFVLMPLSITMLKDSQRTYDSIAVQFDDMCREFARALGRESYMSRIDGREIKFRGERALLSQSEVMMLERHMDIMEAVAPMLESADRAKNNAAKCLQLLIGPQIEFPALAKAAWFLFQCGPVLEWLPLVNGALLHLKQKV